MNIIKIYHGSSDIIKQPILGKGKLYNDYGQGFYCTEHKELAKEWACNEDCDGYVNQYELDIENLKILNLSSKEYNILHWMTLLITYRQFRLSNPIMKKGAEWLIQHYTIDINKYDVIIGYRADDSYFAFARAFLNNGISLSQLNKAMRLGKLGEQIVLKSEKAFQSLEFIGYERAENVIYYAKRKIRDDQAREDYLKELEKEETNGIYLRNLMHEEVVIDEIL